MLDRRAHWEKIYGERKPDEVSWHQERPALSLELIREAGLAKEARIIDVGGGASRLVDALLDGGFLRVAVLDISARALALAKERLGARAGQATWIESDVTAFAPQGIYDLWHDRAVFHFLTEKADRESYFRVVRRALKHGGTLVLATFASDGPEKCSGLPVRRYDENLVKESFRDGFDLIREVSESHRTPWGTEQRFSYFLLTRR